jgi:hypothetical protein
MRICISFAFALAFVVSASAQTSVPYFSDFEADGGGWTPTFDWEHGIPVGFDQAPYGGPEPVGGHSGDYVWGTVIGGAHNPSTTSDLTQSFDFTGVTGAELSFWEWLDSGGNSFDMAQVFVNGNLEYLADGGPTNGWREMVLDLSAYDGLASVEIDFQFYASSVVERVGWYVDDVGITPEPSSLCLLALGALVLRRR